MDNHDQVTMLQKELDQRRKLDAKKDDLAKRVYNLVNSQQGRPPSQAQLQNLRSLAASTDSLEELRIYIWYQMSRAGQPIPRELGQPLVDIIGQLAQEDLAIEQVRMFLGYLYRYALHGWPKSDGGQRPSANRSGGNR